MDQRIIRRASAPGGNAVGILPVVALLPCSRSVLVACVLRLLLASLAAATAPSSLTLDVGLGLLSAEVGGHRVVHGSPGPLASCPRARLEFSTRPHMTATLDGPPAVGPLNPVCLTCWLSKVCHVTLSNSALAPADPTLLHRPSLSRCCPCCCRCLWGTTSGRSCWPCAPPWHAHGAWRPCTPRFRSEGASAPAL